MFSVYRYNHFVLFSEMGSFLSRRKKPITKEIVANDWEIKSSDLQIGDLISCGYLDEVCFRYCVIRLRNSKLKFVVETVYKAKKRGCDVAVKTFRQGNLRYNEFFKLVTCRYFLLIKIISGKQR